MGHVMHDFENAKNNLWHDPRVTISGMEDRLGWHEGYRDDFCDVLTAHGCTTPENYATLLSEMSDYSDVGDFLMSQHNQQAEMAAFGLILYERLNNAEVSKLSYKEFFDMTQGLFECHVYVTKGRARSEMALYGAHARLANDPKQKDKKTVRECWDSWQKDPSRYPSKAAFARDMLSKFESLKNHRVIERWCLVWESVSI